MIITTILTFIIINLNSPYELVTLMDKQLHVTDPCCSYMKNQDNSISSLNNELTESELYKLSCEGMKVKKQQIKYVWMKKSYPK